MGQSSQPKAPSRPASVVTLVVVLGFIVPAGISLNESIAARQDGTPGPASPAALFPILPMPEECTVTPRPFVTLPLGEGTPLAASPAASPMAEPTGAASTTEAVIATMRIYLACVNAGDLPRVFAMASDAYLGQLLQQANLPPLTETIYQYLGTPVPLSDVQMVRIQSISDVQVRPDGSISARIVTVDQDTTTNDIVLVPSATSPTGYVLDQQRHVATMPGTPSA
jgi:hypothetical protein